MAMAGDVADIQDAEDIVTWIRKHPEKVADGTVSTRELVRGTGKKAAEVDQALELLEHHRWVRPVRERKPGRGRPAKIVQVHPTLRGSAM